MWQSLENKELCLLLEDWSQEADDLGKSLDRNLQNYEGAKTDLYQLVGWTSVFQGVIITSIAQAKSVSCHSSLPILILSSLTIAGSVWGCIYKLRQISIHEQKRNSNKASLICHRKLINNLREAGSAFDKPKALANIRNTRQSRDRGRNRVVRFFHRWIISTHGAAMILLLAFSGTALVLLLQLLCMERLEPKR